MSYVSGTYYGDYLTGTYYNDYIDGYEGSDTLVGSYGDDTLVGGYYYQDGYEYDSLSGGYGADTFVIGDYYGSYYQGGGYATINDFNYLEGDKIQVYGSAYNYQVTPYGSGTDIYYQGDLIAHVANTTNVIASYDFVSAGY
ncbi:hypothetical protein [Lyngbya aestuarii]|uniref:hypothetical protein n=1 Tax=Lyngbya aestuarii TaxID=118322 RepID=UPI00403E09C2